MFKDLTLLAIVFIYVIIYEFFMFIFLCFSQGLVNGLQEIDKLKSQVQDVHVPLEVFE